MGPKPRSSGPQGGGVEELDKAISDLTATPGGALLVFLAVFLARVYLDRWDRRRSAKKKKKKEAAHNG